MALYNNGFPATYNPYFQPYQYQMPQYQQQVQPAQNMQQQSMTPPTVHADIIQLSNEQEGVNYPVAAGTSQMMMTKDETVVMVKTAFANGQTNIVYFDKRPPAPPEKPVDLSVYVTRDELENRLAAFTAPAKKTAKKDEVQEG